MYNVPFLDLLKSYINYCKSNIEHIAWYRKKYRNYLRVTFGVLLNRYPIIVILHNGNKITCSDYFDVYNNVMNLTSDPKEDIVYANGLKFYGGKMDVSMVDIFVREVYKFLPVSNKVIVDIGASLADSSIYFASRGARKVISVQSDVMHLQLAKKNIEANNLSEKIEILHSTCIGTNSNDYAGIIPAGSMTLEQILNKFKQSPPEILKVAGLAGREYSIFLTTPESILAKFNHIGIEYSFGYRNLKEKLEKCGFHVTASGPKYIKYPFQRPAVFRSHMPRDKIDNMFIGFIHARKV